jgi:uncharacterized RDD family membrane protein YckC
MSDPTDATPDGPEPATPPPDALPPQVDGAQSAGPIGDETARMPVEPEVGWDSTPEAPRPMPWEAPAAVPPPATGGLATPPTDPAAPADQGAVPTGVLSAATVGWVAPPPEPVATGTPGWVIAGVGVRLGAWILDGVLGFILLFSLGLAFGIAAVIVGQDPATLPDWTFLLAGLGFYFVYFVGFWTSQGKATPGMRAFKLQVANAADGKRLEIGPAVKRWLALGYVFSLIGVVPALSPLASLVTLVWIIALLITTSQDRMHQGLHDRWAESVVVRPEGAGAGGGAVVACLVIALLFMFLALVAIIGLIFLGTQISGMEVTQSP